MTKEQKALVKVTTDGKSNVDNLSHLFSLNGRECYNLRNTNHMLLVPKPNTIFIKRTFSYQYTASLTWNA